MARRGGAWYRGGHSGPYRGRTPEHPHHEAGQMRALTQEQTQRTLQASEQMLYQVYENAIGMIEELEKHEEHGKSAGNSGLLRHVIPANRRRDKRDVEAIIVGQLVALDAQMTYAPPDVTRKARMKMLDKTLMWVAAREEQEIPKGLVDLYAKSVVQLLAEPETMKLPERERHPTPGQLDERAVNDFLSHYAQARQQAQEQDKEFFDNPEKKATMRDIRQGKNQLHGISRLVNLDRNDARFREALIKQDKEAMDIN